MKKRFPLLVPGVVVMLAGCTLAPKYERPEAPVPGTWPEGALHDSAASNQPGEGAARELEWQEFFADARLRNVIATALANNRDLRLAVLNVDRARAMYGIARSDLLPQVEAVGSGSRQRLPADLSPTGARDTSSRYDANLGVASWEIDFFGRIRSLKDRALEEFLATEQARRSAQILLVSSVANAWLALAADTESLDLANTTLKAQRGAYDLVKRRHDLGLVQELDLYRAQTQVDAARADVARFTQLTALDRNALNLLAGSPVDTADLPSDLAHVAPPRQLAAGLPSEVLLWRPDVLRAEHLLKAANADIGAARAAFFPRVSLTAAIGSASSELDGLFQSGSGAWSYAPRIVMPVFDARTWSAARAAKVQREMAVAEYERAIQEAFREVADALAVRGTVNHQVEAQQSLVKAQSETYRLAQSRYEKGIDSYLAVLDAQRSLYAAQQGLVSVQFAKVANQARLYAVLGGGWSEEDGETGGGFAPAEPGGE